VSGLPSAWRNREGKDLFEIVRGVSYDKSTVRTTPHTGFVPVLRATNIQGGSIITDDGFFASIIISFLSLKDLSRRSNVYDLAIY
jgi:type I restriction enzyme, S subunit